MQPHKRREMLRQLSNQLMTPAEVAELFDVTPKTISKWVDEGKLSAIKTPGGHRRIKTSEVVDLVEQGLLRVAPQSDV